MNNKLQAAIARVIKTTRVAAELTQEELAHSCGLDRTYISGIERQARNLTIKTLERIIISLPLTEQDFFLRVIEELNND